MAMHLRVTRTVALVAYMPLMASLLLTLLQQLLLSALRLFYSLPVSAATRTSYNISTLSYKSTYYRLFWRFFLSLVEMLTALPSLLSTIFPSTKSFKIFPAYQTALRL